MRTLSATPPTVEPAAQHVDGVRVLAVHRTLPGKVGGGQAGDQQRGHVHRAQDDHDLVAEALAQVRMGHAEDARRVQGLKSLEGMCACMLRYLMLLRNIYSVFMLSP